MISAIESAMRSSLDHELNKQWLICPNTIDSLVGVCKMIEGDEKEKNCSNEETEALHAASPTYADRLLSS